MFITHSKLEKNVLTLIENEFNFINSFFDKPLNTDINNIDQNPLPNFFAYHYTYLAKEVINAWLPLSLWRSSVDIYDEMWPKDIKIQLGKNSFNTHKYKGFNSSLQEQFKLLGAVIDIKDHFDNPKIPPYHIDILISTNANATSSLTPILYRNIDLILRSLKPVYLTYTIKLTGDMNVNLVFGGTFNPGQMVFLQLVKEL